MTLFEQAIEFAVEKHTGMMRKRESIPFILHPMEVAVIVGSMTDDEEVLAASILHDTVEDTDATPEEISAHFGPRVAMLVNSETENKREDLPPAETWLIRKEESLEELKYAADPAVKLLWLGDKLSNMRSFYRAWRVGGDAIWESFNQKDPAKQAWYYRSIVTLLRDLKNYEAWQELHDLVETVFSNI